jgi:hypothetical protein
MKTTPNHSVGPVANGAIGDYVSKVLKFLSSLWTSERGYTFIGTKDVASQRWRDHPIDLRHGLRDAERILHQYPRDEYDLYFTPNRFSEPRRKREFGLLTDLGWCDIDAAPPDQFVPSPSILMRTSPGRYQGIWKWDKTHSATRAEAYSHALTYRFGGDPGGWSVTKYLRLPHTYNHKAHYDRPRVQLIKMNLDPISQRPKLIRGVKLHGGPSIAPKFIKSKFSLPAERDLRAVRLIISKYQRNLHPKTRYLATTNRASEPDRSKQIYMMTIDLWNAGATEEELATCLWQNPYFVSKYGNWPAAGFTDTELRCF